MFTPLRKSIEKDNVSPMYDSYVAKVPPGEDILDHPLSDVGWPGPFFAALIFPVLPPSPHSLLGGQ